MDDLISRAALFERFAEMQKNDPEKDGRGFACHFLNDAREPSAEWYCVEDAVECIPAVDAVPVVRCRDCKFWYAEIGASTGWLPCQEIVTDRDWYCGSGKRRESE